MSVLDGNLAEADGAQDSTVLPYWDSPAEPWSIRRSGICAASRLLVYGFLTLGLLPAQLLGLAAWPWLARTVPRLHHRLSARIIGLRVRCEGAPPSADAHLFVSNHVSYFDIIALGSVLPACFVAKSDVSGWPLFGALAKLSRTVFVERKAAGARNQIDHVGDRLDRDDRLIIFPEGTSTDGRRVLPFKSTLFAAAEGRDVTIQPISIGYTRLNGVPIGRALRPLLAWYGDMDLAPPLWAALSIGSAEVVIRFHRPVAAKDFADRKALARHCQAQVADGVGNALVRRPGAA